VGELHLDRARVADLHRTMARQAVGLAFRCELERSLQRLARMIVEQARYHQLKAFRCTTLFWRAATRLGFEVCARYIGWHQRFLGWYQRRLLVRDHPLGIRRLQGRRWESRTLWLSRQELLRRYGAPGG